MKPSVKISALVLVSLLFGSSLALADPIGPVTTPPGGVTRITTGGPLARSPGGINFNFSDLDPDSFSDLYWGPAVTTATFSPSETSNPFTFVSVSGSTAIWETTNNWTDTANNTTYLGVTIELQITLSGAAWVSTASLGAVADVSDGQNFSANVQYLGVGPAGSGLGVTALSNFGPTVTSSFSGGFYYDPPVSSVPDSGATITMLGMAVSGLMWFRRRLQ
jgi:VPDSG-CTERM motif